MDFTVARVQSKEAKSSDASIVWGASLNGDMGFVSNSGYHLRGRRISDVNGMRKVLSKKLQLPETEYAVGQCLGAGSYGSVFDALRWKDVHRAMKRKDPKR
jgi:hypothetical protein